MRTEGQENPIIRFDPALGDMSASPGNTGIGNRAQTCSILPFATLLLFTLLYNHNPH